MKKNNTHEGMMLREEKKNKTASLELFPFNLAFIVQLRDESNNRPSFQKGNGNNTARDALTVGIEGQYHHALLHDDFDARGHCGGILAVR